MKTKLIITAIILFTVFISCNKKSEEHSLLLSETTSAKLKIDDMDKSMAGELQQIPVAKFPQFNSDSIASPVQSSAAAKINWDKKIIKTATLKLEIKDFKKYNSYVHAAARQYGGYIAQEEQNLSDEKLETAITIKVPVEQFENLMNGLPAEDAKVLERKISTDDVTGDIVDTKSRLEAKKQMRLKYLEFLKQSKNMTEVLQVQNEINDIQEQIESATGRVSFLSHQSAYSTINLSFYQPMEGYKPTDNAPSFLTRLTSAFKSGTEWVGDLLIGLIAIWPLILVVTGLYFAWRATRPKKITMQEAQVVTEVD